MAVLDYLPLVPVSQALFVSLRPPGTCGPWWLLSPLGKLTAYQAVGFPWALNVGAPSAPGLHYPALWEFFWVDLPCSLPQGLSSFIGIWYKGLTSAYFTVSFEITGASLTESGVIRECSLFPADVLRLWVT